MSNDIEDNFITGGMGGNVLQTEFPFKKTIFFKLRKKNSQGSWRKVVIDDTIPFNDEDQMLLPATTQEHELWPMLLSKALIKVAALE